MKKKGKTRGLALFGGDRIAFLALSQTKHHIDVVIQQENQDPWRFTSFYKNPKPNLQHHSWELLKRMKSPSSLSWLVEGDYNEILYNSKKQRGSSHNPRVMLDLQLALNVCGL